MDLHVIYLYVTNSIRYYGFFYGKLSFEKIELWENITLLVLLDMEFCIQYIIIIIQNYLVCFFVVGGNSTYYP